MAVLKVDIPDQYNMSEILYHNLDAGRGAKTVIYQGDTTTTYGQLAQMANRVGNGLQELGLAKGGRALLILQDTAAFPAAFFGAIRAGFVAVPVNTTLPDDQYEYLLNDSQAKVAFVDAPLYDNIEAIRRNCPELEHIVVVGGAKIADTIAWEAWTAAALPELDPVPTNKDDQAFWLYSSGSTGFPKGVVHLHKDVPFAMEAYAKGVLDYSEEDKIFSVSKLFFAYGLGNAMNFAYSVGASTVLYAGRPTPEIIFEHIDRYRPSLLFTVPTFYVALLAVPGAEDKYDLSSLRLCISAAESLPADVYRKWYEQFGVEILEGCGSTEMLHIYISNFPNQARPGSTGRLVPGYDIKLVGPEGEEVTSGESGDMLVRGGSGAPFYWNRPEKTEVTMRADGWLFTGDRFYQDEDGFYYFDGRSDDMIRVSGQWLSPAEVENALIEHPAVFESALVAARNKSGLVKPKAFVVLNEGYRPSTQLTIALQTFVKQRLAPYKYPRLVEYVDELPKTATGKIQRFRLREQ